MSQPTNKQLAVQYEVHPRQISKARKNNTKLMSRPRNSLGELKIKEIREESMPPVHILETSHNNHRWGHSGDMRTLSGNPAKVS